MAKMVYRLMELKDKAKSNSTRDYRGNERSSSI